MVGWSFKNIERAGMDREVKDDTGMSDKSFVRPIADEIAKWPSPLEETLFGTAEPAVISQIITRHVLAACGAQAVKVIFYRRGVGAVFGLNLVDRRRVVVKVHRTDLVGETLPARSKVQHHLASRGLPVPRPLAEPTRLANGIATIEEYLDEGELSDSRLPGMIDSFALGLHSFIAVASELVGSVDLPLAWPLGLTEDRLWPTPHDLRFDFSAPGGEWIDDLGRTAREQLAKLDGGEVVITHADWRAEHLRFKGSELATIYDMDSTALSREPYAVGSTAHSFSTNWADATKHSIPSPAESVAFVRAYERARQRQFSIEELAAVEAAYKYILAYSARCEHSDRVLGLFPDKGNNGWRGLLRKATATPLFSQE